jgi:KaiC/GvpD/RAD55 family RecA-like ATPase
LRQKGGEPVSDLAKTILSLFRGRHDHIAFATEKGFEPAGNSPCVELIDAHLAGKESFGFYLMTADSKVWCTCVDFDNKPDKPNPEYENQAHNLYLALRNYQLFPLMELSQSGSGYHVWLFFAEAVEAYVARSWWRGVEQKMGVKFREVYPRQDRQIGKGMGSLVRYPLWNKSCFVDPEEGFAHLDPAEALGSVQRIRREDLPLLAFQLGMGDLKPEPVLSLAGGTPDGMLPLRVQRLLERTHSLIARRWSGDTQGMKDTSNSAVAMSLAVEMVRLYVPTPEIGSALRYWCQQRGATKGEREDWINLTVTKAYDFIITRQETKSVVDTGTFEKASYAYLDTLEQGTQVYIPSGLAKLDQSVDGVARGEVCVIAARPGHGKSALAFQWIDNAAKMGINCLLISEEMGAIEIGKRRVLSIVTADQERWEASIVPAMREEVGRYHKGRAPCYIVENCNTIDRVDEVIDQFVSIHNVGFAAVDYLQLLKGRSNADRYQVVTELSQRLKQSAKRNNIPLLVLSQLNRSVEGRQDNEPKLSDLRESGQIEQDADLIMFLQWPHKFSHNVDPKNYRIYCAKRRNGPIREPKIETEFNAARQLLGEQWLAQEYDDRRHP